MPDLETLIADAAKSGRISGLTLWRDNTGYQASLSPDRKSWRVEHHTDPVEALKLALTERTFQTTDEDIFA